MESSRSNLSQLRPDAVVIILMPSLDRLRRCRFMLATSSPHFVSTILQEIWCSSLSSAHPAVFYTSVTQTLSPAHDPDYVPEPIYPEYIQLEDEHEFPGEEQPLPPVDSPTAESPGYVTESDPEEDPEEYEDDETEDGPTDYLLFDDGDDSDQPLTLKGLSLNALEFEQCGL
ncbi:hypothetical protein Tco_0123283 [Tanacetum coccineum]